MDGSRKLEGDVDRHDSSVLGRKLLEGSADSEEELGKKLDGHPAELPLVRSSALPEEVD